MIRRVAGWVERMIRRVEGPRTGSVMATILVFAAVLGFLVGLIEWTKPSRSGPAMPRRATPPSSIRRVPKVPVNRPADVSRRHLATQTIVLLG